MCRVLSGPHLRRVEESGIAVQIILEEDRDLELTVYREEKTLDLVCDIRKIKIAEKIYFYLIRAKLSMESKCLYHYDVSYKQNSIIKDLGLGLGESVQLPSFEFGAERILTGSCRNLSSCEDDYLAKMIDQFDRPEMRPQMLILTGDQIYADDLSEDLLLKIKSLSDKYALTLPEKFNIKDRKKLCQSLGLTSAKSKNHLLSFGELIILYLLSWSYELWEDGDQIVDKEDMQNIAKVFANVPVYMQMDDHDISDDFKINEYWSAKLDNGAVEILANACAAGYLFQLMGNYLESSDYEDLVLKYISSNSADDFDLMSRVVSEADWSNKLKIAKKSFLFFDTRNFRLGGRDSKLPAGMMRVDKLKSMFREDLGEDLVIISPSPIYGYEHIEKLQSNLAFLPSSVPLIDREGWHAAELNSEELISLNTLEECLSRCGANRILIISGDVHYSFIRRVDLAHVKILQLVVSPLKNKPPLTLLARSGFSFYNTHSDDPNFMTSDHRCKIISHSNYCFLKLESEIEISMYSRETEHKFNLDKMNNDLA
ncbi:hypothetical protein PQO01_17725 [Lentisphaera marina]|uniref:hypothetical protein n=1 Tax=Lentisphaera marina TaxID=1111041 RepID=UPI002366A647|nr:hypothetical protein [Lentisphaera marina]MDD7986793.1 hypothetical protein [Lentisphaera marina]